MSDFSEVITIDGPTGAGKTTLGHWLADLFACEYLESGYLYRAATRQAIAEGVDRNSWDGELLTGLHVRPRTPSPGGHDQEVCFGARRPTLEDDLFAKEVDELVARVAAVPAVRRSVRDIVRDIAHRRKMVISGRDAGTQIVPEARHKLFLLATKEVRIARVRGRDGEPQALPDESPRGPERGAATSRQELESQLLSSQLQPAQDALVIETSATTIDAVRARALHHLRRA